MGEILKKLPVEDRELIENLVKDFIPEAAEAEYKESVRRLHIEEEYERIIGLTDITEHAFLAKFVNDGLKKLCGNEDHGLEQTSFERRAHFASVQRGWASLILMRQCKDTTKPISIEKVAKQLHVGWARHVISEWDPLYGLETVGCPLVGKNGLFEASNFATVDGYHLYQQRVTMAQRQYLLPGDAPTTTQLLSESQRHSYRAAAEMLLFISRSRGEPMDRPVEREDKLVGVELTMAGVIATVAAQ